MTEAKNRRSKVKGAVLLMVLAVMVVLIIMLAGTITVIYSAHNRSLLKYEESQAYYTSRSVLDTYTDSMIGNKTETIAGKEYYYVDSSGGTPTLKGIRADDGKDYTLGMAFEEDLFSLPVSTDSTWYSDFCTKNGYSAADGVKYVNIKASDVNTDANYTTLQNFYKQYFVRENWSASCQEGVNDTITYNVGSLDNYGDGYGKMVDTATDVYITVQMLEREYNLGSGSNFAEQFRNGNRTKDYVKCKATVHIIYDGRETTTSKIMVTGEQNQPDSDGAIVSLSDIAGSDTVTSIGGAASLHNGVMTWTNNTTTTGNLFIWDGVTFQNTQPNVYILGGEQFVSLGTITMDQYPHALTGSILYAQKIIAIGAQPFPGVEGGLQQRNNIITPEFEINSNALNSLEVYGRVFAEKLSFPSGVGNNGYKFYDSVYINELSYHENVPNPADADINTRLFKFSYNSGTVTIKPTKDFYTRFPGVIDLTNTASVNIEDAITVVSNGVSYTIDLKNPFASNYFDGRAVTAVNVVFDSTVFNGDPDAATWQTNIPTQVSFGTPSTNKEVLVDYNNNTYWTLDSDFKKETTLPDNLIAGGTTTNVLKLHTPKSLYKDYMYDNTSGGSYDGDTFDSFGNFNSSAGAGSLDFTNSTVLSGFISEHVKPAEVVKSDVSTASAITNTAIGARDPSVESGYPSSEQIPSTYTRVISTDTKLDAGVSYGTVAIDARASDINIQLGDGTGGQFFGTFVTFGENKVNFLMPATTSGVVYDLGSSGYDFVAYDYETEKYYLSKGKYTVGKSASNPTSAPDINYYAAQNVSDITIWRGGWIHGYFYAPFSTFTLGGGANGISRNVNYNDCITMNNVPTVVCGSVFCNKYGGSQKPGVVFMDPNADETKQYQPKLYWDRTKWISSYD